MGNVRERMSEVKTAVMVETVETMASCNRSEAGRPGHIKLLLGTWEDYERYVIFVGIIYYVPHLCPARFCLSSIDAFPPPQKRSASAAFLEYSVHYWLSRQIKLKATDRVTPLMQRSNQGDLAKVKHPGKRIGFLTEEQQVIVRPTCTLTTTQVEKEGVDVNARSEDGSTALIFAAMKGHTEVAKFLLLKGGPMDYTDSNGFSALTYAIREGHKETYDLLLEAGANPNTTTGNALMTAVFSVNNRQMLPLHIRQHTKPGRATLYYIEAEARDTSLAIQVLLRYGATPDLPCNTVLYAPWAISDGKISTPLMVASSRGHEEVVKAFVRKGCDLDWKDGNGRTALMMAAAFGYASVVDLLLYYGAGATAKDSNGKTAADLAREHGKNDIAAKISRSVKGNAAGNPFIAILKAQFFGTKQQENMDQLALPLIGLCGVSSMTFAASKGPYTRAYSSSSSSPSSSSASSKSTGTMPCLSTARPLPVFGIMPRPSPYSMPSALGLYHHERHHQPGLTSVMSQSATRRINRFGNIAELGKLSRLIVRRVLK